MVRSILPQRSRGIGKIGAHFAGDVELVKKSPTPSKHPVLSGLASCRVFEMTKPLVDLFTRHYG
jgi:hypothetical protein